KHIALDGQEFTRLLEMLLGVLLDCGNGPVEQQGKISLGEELASSRAIDSGLRQPNHATDASIARPGCMKHNKHEVILFHVHEKTRELDFSYDPRPLKFVDMETGKELKLNPGDVKEKYVASMSRYFNDIKLKCMQYHIDFVPSDINEGFEKILLSFLIKRARLY
ncbi:MAG: hypothetical protein R6U86_06440, partial [Bacteroidales bacterium]